MIELIVAIICRVVFTVVFAFYDSSFLNEGQTRGFLGIYNSDGTVNILDTLKERSGLSGNPLFWD